MGTYTYNNKISNVIASMSVTNLKDKVFTLTGTKNVINLNLKYMYLENKILFHKNVIYPTI